MQEGAESERYRINERVRRSGIHKDFRTVFGRVLDVKESVSESGFERAMR